MVAALTLVGASSRVQAQVSASLTPVRFTLALNPGNTLSTSIKFSNTSGPALYVWLEAQDFMPSDEEGRVAAGAETPPRYALKDWIAIEAAPVHVARNQTIALPFTIQVPPEAQPGARWAAVVVRTETAEAGTLPDPLIHLGSPVLLNVAGNAEEKLTVKSLTASRFAEHLPVTLTARFANEGAMYETPKGRVTVRDLLRRTVATIELPERNILPGFTRKVDAEITDSLRLGPYTASMEVHYGQEGEHIVRAQTTIWLLPWRGAAITIAITLALFGALGLLVARHARRSKQAVRSNDNPHQPETL